MRKKKRLKREIEAYYAELAARAERGELVVSGRRLYGDDAPLNAESEDSEDGTESRASETQ